ncbi:conserved virulence factor C family protein [Pseudogracilibacillus sp. ICA-222130]|uniref:conserved virulence factor C family protein n=1 Tax=Pseudogracilibacillus sp. ICA-222130 TaxID=3134655 RepID=UPI0030C121F9
MKIISMEPTPSPYSMKVNVNETLPDGEAFNFLETDPLHEAPSYIQKLFEINGVKGVYRVIDFITIERNPRVPWEEILPEVYTIFGADSNTDDLFSKAVTQEENEAFGEVKVEIQMIRNIPTQVKLTEAEVEKRYALPERLTNAAMEAASASNSYLLERKWIEQSPRYGELDEIGRAVVEELDAAYTDERLNQLLQAALLDEAPKETYRQKVTVHMLEADNWRDRYAVLANMPDPTEDDYPLLNKALEDDNSSVRRIATAYLGMIEQKETLPYLYKALRDRSVNVRRTAGDCLSDLGFKEAIPEMIQTLEDKSRIVRWRAAMFLYEVGDETAIPALQKALEDTEFEVRMQAKMALTRIESGKEGEGSIWQQMEQATKKN